MPSEQPCGICQKPYWWHLQKHRGDDCHAFATRKELWRAKAFPGHGDNFRFVGYTDFLHLKLWPKRRRGEF